MESTRILASRSVPCCLASHHLHFVSNLHLILYSSSTSLVSYHRQLSTSHGLRVRLRVGYAPSSTAVQRRPSRRQWIRVPPRSSRQGETPQLSLHCHLLTTIQTFRSFARCADAELIDYLRSRHVSPSFLSEIDQFLSAHPEIAFHKPDWAHEINNSRPLDAYLYFIKGWTRAARYIEGVGCTLGAF